jgi:hypothetical protein
MAGKGVDGTGKNSPKGTTPQDSVDVTVRSDAPGGENSGAKIEGPNPGGKGGGKY